MKDKVSISKVGIRFGLLSVLGFIIYTLLMEILGMSTNTSLGYLSYVILVFAIIYSYRTYKINNNNSMSFGQGLKLGMIITSITALVYSSFYYAYLKFIDDSTIFALREKQVEEFQNMGFSDEKIAESMKMTESYSNPEAIFIISVVFTLFIGVIMSLIISGIMQKREESILQDGYLG